MPDDAEVLTVEFKTNLLAPARGEHFIFRGRVVKPGRTITVCEAQAFAVEESQEKLLATMTGTLMAILIEMTSSVNRDWNVSYWHLADIEKLSRNVCFRG
jgi:hypothetical protein